MGSLFRGREPAKSAFFRGARGVCCALPELDVASQGETIEEALANLKEAAELFLETASSSEIEERLHGEVFVTRFEAAHA